MIAKTLFVALLAGVALAQAPEGSIDQQTMQQLLDAVSESCREELMTSTELTDSCKTEVQEAASTLRAQSASAHQMDRAKREADAAKAAAAEAAQAANKGSSAGTVAVILGFVGLLVGGLVAVALYINQAREEAGHLQPPKKKLSKKKLEKQRRKQQ